MFLQTGHNKNVTNVEKLDALTHRYLKKWSEMAICIFHMKKGMWIQTIFTLHETVHCSNHNQMRIKSDRVVNAELDSAFYFK